LDLLAACTDLLGLLEILQILAGSTEFEELNMQDGDYLDYH